MMEFVLKCLFLIVCVCLCAFFSGMETGIISINRLRILHRSRNGSTDAKIIGNYLRKPDILLATTLVGTNLVTVIISTMSADLATNHFGASGSTIAAVGSTLILLVFGEFLPKAWFSSRPLERCLPLARMMKVMEVVFSPFSYMIMSITSFVDGGKSSKKNGDKIITREHLQWLTRDSEAGGKISTLERLMISRILTLQLKTATEIMTPWSRVEWLAADATLADAAAKIREHRHLKIPVLSHDKKTCIGVLYIQDVLAKMSEFSDLPVTAFLRKPFYVRSDMRADDIMPVMKRGSQRMAIIRDKSGKLLGVVTVDGIMRIFVSNLPPETSGDRKAEKSDAIVTSFQPRVAKPPVGKQRRYKKSKVQRGHDSAIGDTSNESGRGR